MAKKDKSTTSSLVDEFVKATKAITPSIPDNADPFEIAQRASALVRMANTPQITETLKQYSNVLNVLVATEQARISAILTN